MASARPVEAPRFCSRCGNAVVVVDAVYCKECGAPLAATIWLNRNMTWRPWTALILSIMPGCGQWYKGQRLCGVGWLVGVSFLYMAIYPLGLLMHIICALNAALGGALKEDLPIRWGDRRSSASSSTRARPT